MFGGLRRSPLIRGGGSNGGSATGQRTRGDRAGEVEVQEGDSRRVGIGPVRRDSGRGDGTRCDVSELLKQSSKMSGGLGVKPEGENLYDSGFNRDLC